MNRAISSLLIAFAFCHYSEAAQNIFDDDWKPPKTATARPATKPSVPPNVPTPATPPQAPVTPNAIVPELRHAVPSSAQQAAVRKIMKEVFAEQLADRSVAGRHKLAEALLTQAAKSADVPDDQFVLLAAAVDASIDAAALPLAFRAADQMAKSFDVDGLAVKAETVVLVKSVGPPAVAEENVRAALKLTDELVDVDDYYSATRVCAAAQPAASNNPDLRLLVQKRLRELTTAREASERVAKDREKLKTAPDDAPANLAVGSHECFIRGNWETGLLLLAKGSDAKLKSLATAELSATAGGDALAKAADGWWESATRQTDATARSAIMRHAASLYQQCLDVTTGLRRQQLEKRIAEALPASPGGTVKSTKVTVIVAGDKPWQEFGETKRGDVLSISAQGEWIFRGGVAAVARSGGDFRGTLYGYLEGRIGESGEIFKIGDSATYTVPQNGVLFLQMHDSNFRDNSGQMSVVIGALARTAASLPRPAGWRARNATRQQLFAVGNNGCIVTINGRQAMLVNRDKATSLAVALVEGDVIAVKLTDRFDINSFWLACVSPSGEFLFETSEQWSSYLPGDAGRWWDIKANNTQQKPAESAPAKQEYVDLVKRSAEQTGQFRGNQPIRSVLSDGGKNAYLYYVVGKGDLLPKK